MKRQTFERILGGIFLVCGIISAVVGIDSLNVWLLTAAAVFMWWTLILFASSFFCVTVYVLEKQPERTERLRTVYIDMDTDEIILKPYNDSHLWEADGNHVVVCPAVIVEKEKQGKLDSLKSYIMSLFG